MRAVLSIGSNMDDRVELLRTVFDEFAGEIVAASPVYATPVSYTHLTLPTILRV